MGKGKKGQEKRREGNMLGYSEFKVSLDYIVRLDPPPTKRRGKKRKKKKKDTKKEKKETKD